MIGDDDENESVQFPAKSVDDDVFILHDESIAWRKPNIRDTQILNPDVVQLDSSAKTRDN